MRKYWNALLYGDAKTKRILASAILFGILAIVGVVLAVSGKGIIWALVAMFAAVMDLVVLWSVRFGETKLRDVKKKEDIGERTFDSVAQISEGDVRQLLVRYKVKKEHVLVMVDSYAKEHVRQSPAYLWTDRGYLQLLVMGEKPRNLAVPLGSVDKITYLRNVEVDVKREYEELRKPSFLNMLFQEYLPVYAERQKDGKKVVTKNLYSIAPGINITNTSIKNVNQILKLPISFEGVLDARFHRSYQEAYRMKVLLMDKVLSPAAYKEQVGLIVRKMADGESDFKEFTYNLELMVRARLVTREVADYYMDYRQKQEKKKK